MIFFFPFSFGMLVLLTKTLTRHLHHVDLAFPSEKGGIVLLGIWVHSDPLACLWEALISPTKQQGAHAYEFSLKFGTRITMKYINSLYEGTLSALVFGKMKDFYLLTLQCMELLAS